MSPAAGLAVRGVYATAALLTGGALALTLWQGLEQPANALAFGVFIAVGELARWGALPGEREPAPLGAAGALAYALLGECAGQPTTHGVLQVVSVVVAAALAGAAPHVARGSGPALDHVARRVLTVSFAAACFQPLYNSGELERWVGHGAYYALFLVVLLLLTALCDAVLAAAMLHARTLPLAPSAGEVPPSRTHRCCVTSSELSSASVRPSARAES